MSASVGQPGYLPYCGACPSLIRMERKDDMQAFVCPRCGLRTRKVNGQDMFDQTAPDQAEPIGADPFDDCLGVHVQANAARLAASIATTRTPDLKAAGVERETTIEDLARQSLADRVTALRAADAAPGGGQAKDFCAENAQKSPDLHALEVAAKEIERVTALNVKSRRDRADDSLAFEFQGLGDVLAKAVRDLSTPTAAPAPNVQALVEVWEQARSNHERYSATGSDENDIRFLTLGLTGEAGELANFVKKRWRDGVSHDEAIRFEIADVCAYAFMLAQKMGMSPADLIQVIAHKQAVFVEKMAAIQALVGEGVA